MNAPYRVPDPVPFNAPLPPERQGTLMSKWTLNGVSLEWEHGDSSSAVLRVEGGGHTAKAQLDVDELRELRAMIERAINEVSP